jgi:heat shock protein HslJ
MATLAKGRTSRRRDSSLRYGLHSTVIVLGVLAAACGSTREAVGPSDAPAASKAASTTSLIGPTWRLATIDGREAVPGVRVTATFAEDDRVSGTAGCNRYFGRAAAAGSRLDVGRLATTMMYCGAEGVMPQEQAYLAALEKAKSYRIAGSELRVGPSAAAPTLVFFRE